MGAALVTKRKSARSVDTYVVVRYSPPGNVQGLFAQNVGQKVL